MNLDKISSAELVDSFMIPEQLSLEQKSRADQELAVIRKQRRKEQSTQEKLYGQLLQLRITMQDYIKQETFDPEKNFAYFLKSYIEIQHKKKLEVAIELDIHKTKLSQLLSGNREPSEEFFVRLEIHSNQFIPARDWFRILMKQKEYVLVNNISLRNKEKKRVKGQLPLDLISH